MLDPDLKNIPPITQPGKVATCAKIYPDIFFEEAKNSSLLSNRAPWAGFLDKVKNGCQGISLSRRKCRLRLKLRLVISQGFTAELTRLLIFFEVYEYGKLCAKAQAHMMRGLDANFSAGAPYPYTAINPNNPMTNSTMVDRLVKELEHLDSNWQK